ncbi:U-box domain-containing protein 33 [Ricinus communis]|uniref:RING-type E3 ubiquitin transferase n=1 Tax=Ricinus communis TaxID=3988 RepID=B9RDT0_RICCO|nr:U-box domain-containing protein 33 [Ricinus communis]EEF50538.1 receptor protein kinase, putative [Ricinus communis]|eukprot:XP_002511869.1 U-box domain-containing protein 33 [Ricinus communis]
MATRHAESSSSRESLSRGADDDTVYVAVGKDFEENKLNLLWALENFPGKKFCILHVHQPAKMIPLVGGQFPASRLNQHELREFQELERKIMHKILDDYLSLCHQVEVHAEKLCTEMDEIGRGILELVYQHDIKKLVMGAAANKHYSDEMMDLKSKKAKYVQRLVPHSCQIWYICKGYSICSWEANSTSSATNGFGDSTSFLHHRTEGGGLELESREVPESEDDTHNVDILDGSSIDQLYGQAMLEAEKFKQEAFEEYLRRGKAEKTAIKAVCRAKALESLYARELRYRKETEEALAREKEDHQRTKKQRDEDRLVTMDQRLLQQIQVSELNDEIFSVVEQCKEYKKERDMLQVEQDNVFKLVQELSGTQAGGASCSQMHESLFNFSMSEILEATCNFDPLLRIGESGHGDIYKGIVRHTAVVIKVLSSDSTEGPIEFQQEVELLSKLRHPNVVILIGVCLEACALIYECLPNGSLEDRLSCNDNSSPLPWQARTLIAIQLCSILIFLHSSNPDSIVHGDLKTGNVLLDDNFACKLSDFGICRANSLLENSRGATCDHLDPHFLTTGELSPTSDTYSFGIILFQLLTGRSAFSVVNDIRDVIDEGSVSLFLDPLAGDWPIVQGKQLTRLALNCCNMNPSSRPDLVSEVWRVLEPMRASCSTSLQFGSQDTEQPPSYFVCPILQEVMQDPHVAADGFTYEAGALTGWLESGHNTSPMTNLVLPHLNLVPNRALRSAIQEWQQQH